MMTDVPAEIRERHFASKLERPQVRLFALVDGLQYELHHLARLETMQGEVIALFAGTEDAHLAHAGPWLVDSQKAEPALLASIAELEPALPSVSWLIAESDLHTLAKALQYRMYVRSPDGRDALLRYWDPRVMAGLAAALRDDQRETFFKGIEEWHFLDNGQRQWIGRPHAQA